MHKSISDLFAERGEEGFRLLEQKMLHEAGEFENVLIACGGGTPCFFDNMDYMNHTGETVFLDVCPEVLFRRLKIAKAKRPLLANKTDEELMQVITSALEKRLPYYSKAKWRFNAEELESYAQIDRAVSRLNELIN
jgi:shikimate kinase